MTHTERRTDKKPGNPWFAQVYQARRLGKLTAEHKDILHWLRTFRGHGGQIFPSHEALAARAGFSVSTVQRALKRAREAGLLHWFQRRRRVGWRSLRTSNHYVLTMPEAVREAAARTTGQTDRGVVKRQFSKLERAIQSALGRRPEPVPPQYTPAEQIEFLLTGRLP